MATNKPWSVSCDGKIRHESHRAASVHKKSLIVRKGGGPKVEPYLCPQCGFWHVGGTGQAVRKRRDGVFVKGSRRVMSFEE